MRALLVIGVARALSGNPATVVNRGGGGGGEDASFGGISNQGNTCYLNAVLQALYHVPGFRDGVLDGAKLRRAFWRRGPRKPRDSLALVFAALNRNTTARTKALTRSLGVDPREQQDAQEYLRMLLEHVDAAMFAGRASTELAITSEEADEVGENVTRVTNETFLDVSLDLKPTLREAISAALEPELLADKWKTKEHGYRSATRAWRIDDMPQTLVLHLKRFEYSSVGVLKKLAPLDFPLHFYDYFHRGEHYRLQSVVIHAGEATRGHYYAFVDPRLDDRWLRFDDDRVTPVDYATVRAESIGGSPVAAYILHYVKVGPPAGFVPPPENVQQEEEEVSQEDEVSNSSSTQEEAPAVVEEPSSSSQEEEEEKEEEHSQEKQEDTSLANATRGFRGYVRTVRDRFFTTTRAANESSPHPEESADNNNASQASPPEEAAAAAATEPEATTTAKEEEEES